MRRIAVLTLPFLLAAVLAACGDDDDTSSSESQSTTSTVESDTTTTATGESSAAVVKFTSSDFGDILTDTDDNTLYLFEKDTGTTSTCEAGCIEAWPPVTVTGTPTGDGIDAALGTTTRSDGTMQLTFNGHPIYYFASDSEPGDTNGQGVGDVWFVVDKEGNAVKKAAGTGGDTSTTQAAGGSGSGY
ncbi:MAG TPA: hypothetical protein VJM33_17965 [Microthrixaceae bacterium]|nr:hypothetical protein [Microthrixaceae bacterium]